MFHSNKNKSSNIGYIDMPLQKAQELEHSHWIGEPG